jgi:hypothetical protein
MISLISLWILSARLLVLFLLFFFRWQRKFDPKLIGEWPQQTVRERSILIRGGEGDQ